MPQFILNPRKKWECPKCHYIWRGTVAIAPWCSCDADFEKAPPRPAFVPALQKAKADQNPQRIKDDYLKDKILDVLSRGPRTAEYVQNAVNCGRAPGMMKGMVCLHELVINTPVVEKDTLFSLPGMSEAEKIDVVYTLGTGSRWNDNELRYSLRSVEKFFPELGRVFIVGHKPAWLKNVVHVPCADIHRHNKDANLIEKVLAACRAGVSKKFMRMSDDELFLRKTLYAQMVPLHYGDLHQKSPSFFAGNWKNHLRNTRDRLAASNLGAVHFDTHTPNAYDRDVFLAVMNAHPWATTPMTINTLYYNAAIIPGRSAGSEAASFHYVTNDENHIRQKLQKAVYLNFNDAGLSPAMINVLAELFPEPSRFEADNQIEPTPTSMVVPIAVPIVATPPEPIPWTRMLMYDDLARDSRELIGRLPAEIDAVAGSARSGLMPATIIATALHLQLFSIGAAGVVFPGQGNRLLKKWPLPKCVLVIEDTASSGNAITEAAQKAAKNWPNAKIIKAAIYASSRGAKACDLVGKIYERPHFLEWNFPNAWIYANMAYDFDGIFCEDCPKDADDDGPRYEDFLRNARPKYLPRKYPVKLIVTARLEKWRPQTEVWLQRHRIAFQELAMGPWPGLAARRAAHDVDKFKAYCLTHSSCYAFAESEPVQAESICRLARKPVLCPAARKFFIPHGYSWPRMSKLLKA